jgi:hypothetical protein
MEKTINECKECSTGMKMKGMRTQMLRLTDDIASIPQEEINLKRTLEILDGM